MKNIDIIVFGRTLTINVDLTKTFGASASGKSIIIGSTEGNQHVTTPDGKVVSVGVNVYEKA